MKKRTDYRGKEMMYYDKDSLDMITRGMNNAGLEVKLIRYRKNPKTHFDPVMVLEVTKDLEEWNKLNGIEDEENKYVSLYFCFANGKGGWENEYNEEELKKINKYFKQ